MSEREFDYACDGVIIGMQNHLLFFNIVCAWEMSESLTLHVMVSL